MDTFLALLGVAFCIAIPLSLLFLWNTEDPKND